MFSQFSFLSVHLNGDLSIANATNSKLNGPPLIGLMSDVSTYGTDTDIHRCAILGRMLGFDIRIGHLEPPEPSLR